MSKNDYWIEVTIPQGIYYVQQNQVNGTGKPLK